MLASSFGCDHNSELDISCKDGTHSIKETLLNLSTYLSVNTTAKLVKKAFYKNIVPVVYLFVLYRLAGKCTKIYNAYRTIVRLIIKTPCFATFSLLLWCIKSHDVDLSVFCLLLYL